MSDTFQITTSDGLKLLGRRWPVNEADRTGRAVLIHGVGEHSGRYHEVAGVMNGLGIEVVSYDQRGFGRLAGDPGKLPDELTLVTDAVLVFDLVRKERPAEPSPLLVAHSMGATIAAFAVARGLIAPRGLALSSPAIAPRISPFEEQILRGLVTFAPGFALDSRIMPDDVTRDKHEQKKITHDTLMHRTVTPRLLLSIVDQGVWRWPVPEKSACRRCCSWRGAISWSIRTKRSASLPDSPRARRRSINTPRCFTRCSTNGPPIASGCSRISIAGCVTN